MTAVRYAAFESRIVPLLQNDVDTDQIFPARFLKTTTRDGLGKLLFYDWRYDAAGRPRAEFILNRPEAPGANILLAGHNFGCGSSREHAVWALAQSGFRAIIATSFADIFRQNALKNGLLPVQVNPEVHAELAEVRRSYPGCTVAVDLDTQELTLPDGSTASFPVDAFCKHCLLEGVDEIGYVLQHGEEISRFESQHLISLRR